MYLFIQKIRFIYFMCMDVLPSRMFMNQVSTRNWTQALSNLLLWAHVCHDAHVQVREQPSGADSLLPPLRGSQGSTQVTRLGKVFTLWALSPSPP